MIIVELTTEAEVHMHTIATQLYNVLKKNMGRCACCYVWDAGHKKADAQGKRRTYQCPRCRAVELYEKEIGLDRLPGAIENPIK